MSPTPSGRKCQDEIKKWINWLIENNCFSPENFDRSYNAETNIKCYITCPGTADGGICEGSHIKNILRFTPSQRGGRSVGTVLADMIFQVFGGELVRFCHFGTELNIIERLLEKLQGMKVDLRPIFGGAPIYNSKKHIEKLGLQRELPGLCVSQMDKPDVFMKLGVWKTSGGAVGSEGASVNMWALLTAASLVGCNHIHCKSSSRFAQSVLGLILRNAPAAATPGNVIPVRSFHEVSKEVESVLVRADSRPDNFLRHIDDSNFAINGVFSCCKAVEGKMPEDYLGCAYVRELSEFLKCKYHEVPPKHVHGHYQLMPERYYSIFNKEEDIWGSLMINDDGVHVDIDTREAWVWDFDEWEEELRNANYLVMPMIWRSGAVISLDDGDVGCLVPDGTRNSMHDEGCQIQEGDYISNYDHFQFCYHALSKDGVLNAYNVLDTFERLVVPGTFLWIKPGTDSWEKMKSQFPPMSDPNCEDQRVVRVRLNVPLKSNPVLGKVCVTVMRKAESSSLDFTFGHSEIDPWDLTMNPPVDPSLELRELLG